MSDSKPRDLVPCSFIDTQRLSTFIWHRQHGCNCCPLPEGGEKYSLDVADTYRATVDYSPARGWGVMVRYPQGNSTGRGGGGLTRDEAMTWAEEHIVESLTMIRCLMGASSFGGVRPGQRTIYDSLIEHNDKDEWCQERLPEMYYRTEIGDAIGNWEAMARVDFS